MALSYKQGPDGERLSASESELDRLSQQNAQFNSRDIVPPFDRQGRPARTVKPAAGSYPSSGPTFPIIFVDLDVSTTIDTTDRQSATREQVHELNSNFIPEGSIVWARRIGRKWYCNFGSGNGGTGQGFEYGRFNASRTGSGLFNVAPEFAFGGMTSSNTKIIPATQGYYFCSYDIRIASLDPPGGNEKAKIRTSYVSAWMQSPPRARIAFSETTLLFAAGSRPVVDPDPDAPDAILESGTLHSLHGSQIELASTGSPLQLEVQSQQNHRYSGQITVFLHHAITG